MELNNKLDLFDQTNDGLERLQLLADISQLVSDGHRIAANRYRILADNIANNIYKDEITKIVIHVLDKEDEFGNYGRMFAENIASQIALSTDKHKLLECTKKFINRDYDSQNIVNIITQLFLDEENNQDQILNLLNDLSNKGYEFSNPTILKLNHIVESNSPLKDISLTCLINLHENDHKLPQDIINYINNYKELQAHYSALAYIDSPYADRLNAAKSLYEFSIKQQLPIDALDSLKQGLKYVDISNWCIRIMANIEEQLEFSNEETEIIHLALGDVETNKAATNLIENSITKDYENNIHSQSLPILENSTPKPYDSSHQNWLKEKLQNYFPQLHVTHSVTLQLQEKLSQLDWTSTFVEELFNSIGLNNFTELIDFLNFSCEHSVTQKEILDHLKVSGIKQLQQDICKVRAEELAQQYFTLTDSLFEYQRELSQLVNQGWQLII